MPRVSPLAESDLHEHCKDKESLIMRAPRSQKDIHMFIEALRSQRLMEDKCDVVILVGARRFPSHRCILEANCPMFKNMFQSGMKEVNQTEIRLESVDEMAFRAIWDYMYGIELIFEDQQLLPVLLAADYLQMEQVVDCISTAFEKSPTVENAASILFATQSSPVLVHAKSLARAFLACNIHNFFESSVFKDTPTEAFMDILQLSSMEVDCEETVWEAVMTWVDHKPEERKSALPLLLQEVRFPHMSSSYLFTEVAANSDIMAEPSNAQLILEASRYHIPSQRDLIVTQRTKPRLYQDRIWCFGEGPSGKGLFSFSANNWEPSIAHAVQVQVQSRKQEKFVTSMGICPVRGRVCYIGAMRSSIIRVADGQKVNVPLPPASLGLHARATATSSDAAYILGGFGIASNPRHSPIRSCSSNAARLDIAAQTWVSLPKMSTTRSHAVATIHNSVLYVVGGSGNSGLATASVERLDIRTKKWEELPRLPCGVAGAAVAIHNEKLFVTGGEELTWEDALHADTFMFDEGGARWIKLPSMTSPRKYHALVTWRSDLYAVGGMKNSTVETWDGHNWVQIHKFNGFSFLSRPAMNGWSQS